jgi:hypothetical protein
MNHRHPAAAAAAAATTPSSPSTTATHTSSSNGGGVVVGGSGGGGGSVIHQRNGRTNHNHPTHMTTTMLLPTKIPSSWTNTTTTATTTMTTTATTVATTVTTWNKVPLLPLLVLVAIAMIQLVRFPSALFDSSSSSSSSLVGVVVVSSSLSLLPNATSTTSSSASSSSSSSSSSLTSPNVHPIPPSHHDEPSTSTKLLLLPQPDADPPPLQLRPEEEEEEIDNEPKGVPPPTLTTTTTTTTVATTSTSTTTIITHEAAIALYRATVQQTNTNAAQCAHERIHTTPRVVPEQYLPEAMACLQRTNNKKVPQQVVLQYPIQDAEEHFNEIRYVMAPWAQHVRHKYHTANGYGGPWIENQWITHFETLYDTQYNTSCLHDHFGPYIPIFIPWVDHLVSTKYMYPDGFVTALLSVLRPNVPYITVSQNARGLKGKVGIQIKTMIPNLIVLSAGGHGHVPIPLLQQDEPRNNYVDVANRTIGISYVGSLINAPNNVRQILHDQLVTQYGIDSKKKSTTTTTLHPNTTHFHYKYYYGDQWRNVMAQSKWSLVPRGFGRTAYHLMETLQMGLIPVYIYLDNDLPWIPYAKLFPRMGYVTNFGSVTSLIETTLQTISDDEIRRKEQYIVSLRDSHFSMAGILEQIQYFFIQPSKSDLQCQALPRTITGIKKYG